MTQSRGRMMLQHLWDTLQARAATARMARVGFTLRQAGIRVTRGRRLGLRGAVSVAFGATAVAFLGIMGLAVEGGSWYLSQRSGQNAADGAATAGAMRLASGDSVALVQAAGVDSAQRNGIATTVANCFNYGNNPPPGYLVCINSPPASGAFAGDVSAVEAIVHKVRNVAFARMVGLGDTKVTTRAVAKFELAGMPCLLATESTLALGGSSTITGKNCTIASNGAGAQSCDTQGSTSIQVSALRCSGGCDGCGDTNFVHLTTPYTTFAPPSNNPLGAPTPSIFPQFNNRDCVPGQEGKLNLGSAETYSVQSYENNGNKVYCVNGQGVHLTNDQVLDLQPGTHIFYNTNLKMTGASALTCTTCFNSLGAVVAGVNIVFLGESPTIGEINIAGTTVLVLPANRENLLFPALNGVLFYRAPGDCSNATVNATSCVDINGAASSWWAGGMYFPEIVAEINGNAANTPPDSDPLATTFNITLKNGTVMTVPFSTCNVIVASSINLSGSSQTYIDNAGCAAYGINMHNGLKYVRLVE